MSTLVVLGFKNEMGADQLLDDLARLQRQKLITLDDAAVVVRSQDGKPKIKQAVNLVGAGALGGSFWGLLLGTLFFMPLLGMALGALSGALGGLMNDIGIDDEFIKKVGDTVQPGTSALFLLVREATTDKLVDELKGTEFEIIHSSLSKEQDAALRAAFSAEKQSA